MTDPAAVTKRIRRRRSRVWATFKALVRTRVTAGLITILPIVVTIWLIRVVFGWLRDASLWVVDAFLLSTWGRGLLERWGVSPQALSEKGLDVLPERWQWGIAAFSVALTIFVLYTIGLFTANIIGQRSLDLVEAVVGRVPFVKTVYRSLKQVLALFGSDQKQNYQRVALVPFPNEITRSVAFITSTFRDERTREELCSCFIPSTPNPTTGFVFIVKRTDVIEVNWSIEDAIKIIMSGGILMPGNVTMSTAPLAPPGPGRSPGAP